MSKPLRKEESLEAELFSDLLVPQHPANDDLLVKVHEEDIDMNDVFVVEEDLVAAGIAVPITGSAAANLDTDEDSFVIAHENMFDNPFSKGPLSLPAEGEFHDAVEQWGQALINEVKKAKRS